ncbi:hypothetical protein FJ948_26170 [Mesorhizobium sp. B2-3-12]|nr:hypothetical protein FJ948_26170 [Mesorhizobium sp. B2-3-12]
MESTKTEPLESSDVPHVLGHHTSSRLTVQAADENDAAGGQADVNRLGAKLGAYPSMSLGHAREVFKRDFADVIQDTWAARPLRR